MPHGAGCRVDVAIIGAGPAGAATAIQLARTGLAVALLERDDHTAWKIGESLPPASNPLLKTLGVWEGMDGVAVPSYGTCSVWGAPLPRDQSFLFDPHGHGWHVDRAQFDGLLAETAAAVGAQVRLRTNVAGWECVPHAGWRLLLKGANGAPFALRATFVVDASGRRRVFARRNGAVIAVDDRLAAVATRWRATGPAADEDAGTSVEATPDGWWYAARVPGDRLVTAFLSDGDLSALRAARTREGWEALAAATMLRRRLERHGYAMEGAPRPCVANSSRLTTSVGAGWLAVGDAAAAYDPLSSLGMLRALLTGIRAARAIVAALRGDASALAAYAAEVEHDYASYRRELTTYYAMEWRWPDAAFWRRRRTGAV